MQNINKLKQHALDIFGGKRRKTSVFERFFDVFRVFTVGRCRQHCYIFLVQVRSERAKFAQLLRCRRADVGVRRVRHLVGRFFGNRRDGKFFVQFFRLGQFAHARLAARQINFGNFRLVDFLRRLLDRDGQFRADDFAGRFADFLQISLGDPHFVVRQLHTPVQRLAFQAFHADVLVAHRDLADVFFVGFSRKREVFRLQLICRFDVFEVAAAAQFFQIVLAQSFIFLPISLHRVRVVFAQRLLPAAARLHDRLVLGNHQSAGVDIVADNSINVLACTLACHQTRHDSEAAHGDRHAGEKCAHFGAFQVAAGASNDIGSFHFLAPFADFLAGFLVDFAALFAPLLVALLLIIVSIISPSLILTIIWQRLASSSS